MKSQMESALASVFNWARYVAAALFFVYFFLIPSTVGEHSLRASLYRSVCANQMIGLLALLLVFLVSHYFHRLFSPIAAGAHPTVPLSSSAIAHSKHLRVFLLAVGLAVIARQVRDIYVRPLEMNEFCDISRMIHGAYTHSVWAMLHVGQLVSTVAAEAAMKVGGVERVPARLPTIFFGAGFLLALGWLVSLGWSSYVAAIVFLHVAINPAVRTYLHSMRGYAAALMMSTLLLGVVLSWARDPGNPRAKWWLPIFFFLPIFVNSFGSIFSVLLFVATLSWFQANRQWLNREERKQGALTLLACAAVFPFLALLLRMQAQSNGIYVSGETLEGFAEMNTRALPGIFGYVVNNEYLFIKLIALAVAFGFAVRASGKLVPRDLIGRTLVLGVVVMGSLVMIYRIRMEQRYYFEWLVPLTLWLASSAESVRRPLARKVTMGVLGGFLVLGPLILSAGWEQFVGGVYPGFEEFVRLVRKEVPKGSGACMRFSEHPNDLNHTSFYLKWFSSSIYLYDLEWEPGKECKKHYVLAFGDAHADQFTRLGITAPPSAPVLQDASLKAALYAVPADQIPNSTALVSPR